MHHDPRRTSWAPYGDREGDTETPKEQRQREQSMRVRERLRQSGLYPQVFGPTREERDHA